MFCWLPFWWLCYGQLTNNLTSQAATMSLGGVPNDVIANLDPIALIIFIPICDLLLFPSLRKANIRFTPIKKIFTGFMLGCAAMVSNLTCRPEDRNVHHRVAVRQVLTILTVIFRYGLPLFSCTSTALRLAAFTPAIQLANLLQSACGLRPVPTFSSLSLRSLPRLYL